MTKALSNLMTKCFKSERSNPSVPIYFHNFIICSSLLTTLAIGVHASASVALLFFLFEQWDCTIYWWILAICRLVHVQLCLWLPKNVFPWPKKMLPALAVHCSASISLSFFVFEKWECWTYWVIFALCRFVFFCMYVESQLQGISLLHSYLVGSVASKGIQRFFCFNSSSVSVF